MTLFEGKTHSMGSEESKKKDKFAARKAAREAKSKDKEMSEGKTYKDAEEGKKKNKYEMRKAAREAKSKDKEMSEGKTHSMGSEESKKKDKFAARKAAREAKNSSKEMNDEVQYDTEDFMDALFEEKPGNFNSIFQIIMNDKVCRIVEDYKDYLAATMLGNGPPLDLEDEEELDDEDNDETEDDEEQLVELSDKTKKNYAFLARKDVEGRLKKHPIIGRHPESRANMKLTKRLAMSRKVGEDCEYTDDSNTKPHINSTKEGNTERCDHQKKTLRRLKDISRGMGGEAIKENA